MKQAKIAVSTRNRIELTFIQLVSSVKRCSERQKKGIIIE